MTKSKSSKTKTTKRDNRVMLCMVSQQLEHYASGQFVGCSTDALSQDLITKLNIAQIPLAECHTIIHDKDVQQVWSVENDCYFTTPKAEHFHCVMKFTKRTSITQIADALGIEQQYIERQKTRGEHALSNMLAYLIHAKDKDKHQYDWQEVVSTSNAPFKAYYEKYKFEWEHGANVKTKKCVAERIDDVEHDILTGVLTRQQMLLDDNLFECYARYKRRIDDAFDSYTERKMMKTVQAMKNNEFCKTVYYVTGSAGVGKSLFTSHLVAAIIERMRSDGETWSACSCAATNPFDEYDGSEILVMDDVRSCALIASDWLKLLDNFNISVGSARYHNKVVAPRVIIINSERDILEFFYYVKGNGKDGARAEAMDQFFRRILSVIEVLDIEALVDRVKSFRDYDLTVGQHKMRLSQNSRSSVALPNAQVCDASIEFLQNEAEHSPVIYKDNVQVKHETTKPMSISPAQSSYYSREIPLNYSFAFGGQNFKRLQQIIDEKVDEVYHRNHLSERKIPI